MTKGERKGPLGAVEGKTCCKDGNTFVDALAHIFGTRVTGDIQKGTGGRGRDRK